MQRAFLASLVIGALGGYYGVFVVQRKMGFLGSGLAHSTFGGIAIALYLNQEPVWFMAPFTVLVSVLIVYAREKTGLASDTLIGVFFALSMASGILVLSLRREFTTDAATFLFGSLLAVNRNDLIFSLGLLALTIALLFLWKRWAYATFDEELAKSDGVPVRKDNYILAILLALIVSAAVKITGIILLSALLVIPAAASRLLAKSFFVMTLISTASGLMGSGAGVVVAYRLDTPVGATIIVIFSLFFAFSGLFQLAIKSRRSG